MGWYIAWTAIPGDDAARRENMAGHAAVKLPERQNVVYVYDAANGVERDSHNRGLFYIITPTHLSNFSEPGDKDSVEDSDTASDTERSWGFLGCDFLATT